uniref:Fibrinogen-related domain containing protein n=1 Tax=Rhipicephalus appendiculatus TaxID=34631 RepID=A0A131Z145_RHIAP
MRGHFMVLHVLVTTSIVAVNFASEIKGKADDAEELIEEPVEKAGQKLHEFLHLLQYIKKCNKPRQCSDLLRYGQHKSGVFRIYHLKAFRTGQDVYCDMEADGGGWTVIQRRGQFGNRVFNFYRDWNEYAQGFGSPNQEYWIGNEALNALTSGNKNTALRIVLRNSTEDSINIYYNSIRVASADEMYTIQVGTLLGPPGWDGMRLCDGEKFSTYDRDNDKSGDSCAKKFRGGWWYRACHACNPNGLNLNGYHASYADGIEWSVQEGRNNLYHYSYPSMEMMIRPAHFLEGKENQLQFFARKSPAENLPEELE